MMSQKGGWSNLCDTNKKGFLKYVSQRRWVTEMGPGQKFETINMHLGSTLK